MLKKDIKAIFKAIRNRSLDEVKTLIADKPELVHVCNFAPPKKDDGQSTLQVAFKTGSFAIAQFLIEQSADVNFIEKSEINEWRAPALHDCIRAVIFNSYTLNKDQRKFKEGMSLLQLMLSHKADPNAIDSYGNNCLCRALLDSRQVIDYPNAELDSVLLTQLKRVFSALIMAGADSDLANNTRSGASELAKSYGMNKYQLL